MTQLKRYRNISSGSLAVRQDATQMGLSTIGLLQEHSLALQDRKCLLQARNFSLAALLPLLIGLRLCNALVVNLGKVLEHSTEFGLRTLAVRGELCELLIEALKLLCLVLHVLLFCGFCYLVVLCHLFILCLCSI